MTSSKDASKFSENDDEETSMEDVILLPENLEDLLKGSKEMMQHHMWLVNAFSAGCLMALANIVLQVIFERWRSREGWVFDASRTSRSFIVGMLIGYLSHLWYTGLDAAFPSNKPTSVVVKVVMDQIVAGSCMCSIFIIGTSFLEGRTYDEIYKLWLYEFPILYKTDMAFWPPAQMVNFYLIPDSSRLLYVNMASFCWNVVLSYQQHHNHIRAADVMQIQNNMAATTVQQLGQLQITTAATGGGSGSQVERDPTSDSTSLSLSRRRRTTIASPVKKIP